MISIFKIDEKLIENLIDRHDVISFDVFDTLLRRPFINPTDLFDFLEYELSLHDFRSKRIQAEIIARKKYKKNVDVNYAQIYENISVNGLHEIDLESKLLYPRQKIVNIFELAKSKGKKTVILSDMYLDKEFIKNILMKYNIIPDHIFVSGTDQISKYNGSMYSHLISKLGVKPSSIIHFGDNIHSDYIRPMKMGITALHVSNEAPFHKKDEAGHLVFETITNLTKNNRWNSSQLAAIIRDCSEELSPSDPWSELGLCISGPLAFCISQWLHDFAKHDSITDLIFFARDGYLPKYAFDLVKSNTTTHYFPINRTIIVRASFLDVSPALLIQLTAHLPITKLDLLKKYYFESESIVAELSNSTNLKDTIFSEEQLVDFIQFAKISSATLVEEVDKLKSLITKLLDSCNALSRNSKIGFFDVGWLGSVSALLTELWPELKTSKFYYFGTEEQFLLESAHVRALFFHHGIPQLNRNICFQSIELFETMLTAKEHSAVSLLEEGCQIKPVYPKNIAAQIESQRVSLTQMILSAEKFVTFASRDRFSKRWTIDSAMIQAIIVTLMDTESSYVNKALGSLQHQVQSGQSNWVKIAGDSSEIRFLSVIMRWAEGRPIKLGRGSRWGKRGDEVYFNNLKGLKKLIALPFYIRRKKIMNRT